MKAVKVTDHSELEVVGAMAVHPVVLARLAPQFAPTDQDTLPSPFPSVWANLVAGWCVRHLDKHGQPPGRLLGRIARRWASEKTRDPAVEDLVMRFVDSLPKLDPETVNAGYVLEVAAKLIDRTKADRLLDELQTHRDAGRLADFFAAARAADRANVAGSDYTDLLADTAAWDDAFAHPPRGLIRPKGDLGRFYGDVFCPSSFVAFMGPEKRGKCVTGDTLVTLATGQVWRMDRIVNEERTGVEVVCCTTAGKWTKKRIVRCFNNGNLPCVRLLTKAGRELSATAEHKLLTPDGYKRIGDLSPGDFVAAPKRLPLFGNLSLDEQKVRFWAYMMADGHCKKNALSFTKMDHRVMLGFKQACDALHVRHRPKKNRPETQTLSGAEALRAVEEGGLLGKLSKEKEVPSLVYLLIENQVATFLRVLFTCDGTVYDTANGKTQIELGLASEQAVRGVSHLLSRFGIVSAIRKGWKANQSGKRFRVTILSIRGEEYVNRFLQKINFESYKFREPLATKNYRSFIDVLPGPVVRIMWETIKKEGKGKLKEVFGPSAGHIREQLRLRQPFMRQSFMRYKDRHPLIREVLNSPILWDRVAEITEIGQQPVYDIEVEGEHNYLANDLVSHNSQLLIDIAVRGMLAGRRVVMFQVGDLTRPQTMHRIGARIARRPYKPAQDVLVPTRLSFMHGEPAAQYRKQSWHEAMTKEEAVAAVRKLADKLGDAHLFRLVVRPSSTVSPRDIRTTLTGWAREGWVPDFCVIDYADLLLTRGPDKRHGIDEVWQELNRIRQEFNCSVVTASQTKRTSYSKLWMDMDDTAEDKRKLAHVTAAAGINRTKDEMRHGLVRLNWLVNRDDVERRVACVGCVPLASPCMYSVLME